MVVLEMDFFKKESVGKRVSLGTKRLLSSRRLAKETLGYSVKPSDAHAERWEVPTLTLQKLLHLMPKCVANSAGRQRKSIMMASLGWKGILRAARTETNRYQQITT